MTLYIVVPCYNEQEALTVSAAALTNKLDEMINAGKIGNGSRIVFVDDGSKDQTWHIIETLCFENDFVQGIKLSRNRGHQNALLAGLMTVKDNCDAAISIDADLQDDIEAMEEFVNRFNEGCDIVYGVRSSRENDTVFKRVTAQAFYKFMKFMGADIVYNHADYRLMSKRAMCELEKFGEVNLFLRGVVPQIGFKTAEVEYRRGRRCAGESKYPLKKMLSFACNGITSFSIKPIRFITAAGCIIFLISIVMLIYFLIIFALGKTVQGWTTIVISVWAIGGLQLLAIGIIGEYIGKTYLETKARPKFIVEKYIKK